MSKKMPRYFLRDTWYICMDDLSFQEPKVYPRLLLISLHGDLKPISQATQHMYHCTYRVSQKKVSIKNLLFGAAYNFNSQFLN